MELLDGSRCCFSPAIVCDELFVVPKTVMFTVKCIHRKSYLEFCDCGGVESSPAVSNCYVYVGSNDGWIYCLNKTSGIRFDFFWWLLFLHLIVNDFVFVVQERRHLCFNALNGSLGSSKQLYVLIRHCNIGGVCICNRWFLCYALNLTTGLRIWSKYRSVSSSPSLSKVYFYIGSTMVTFVAWMHPTVK